MSAVEVEVPEDFNLYVDMREPVYIKKMVEEMGEAARKPNFLIDVQVDSVKFAAFDVQINKVTLPFADLRFRDMGAERKTLADFVASVHDGRIWKQAFGMYQNYTISFLFVVGDYTLLDVNEQKQVYSTCADVQARYNFNVMFFPTEYMMSYYFFMLCYKHAKHLVPLYHFTKKHPSKADEQVQVLTGIYGCGMRTAKGWLEALDTVKAIVNASSAELAAIKINNRRAGKKGQHAYDVFNTKFSEQELNMEDE